METLCARPCTVINQCEWSSDTSRLASGKVGRSVPRKPRQCQSARRDKPRLNRWVRTSQWANKGSQCGAEARVWSVNKMHAVPLCTPAKSGDNSDSQILIAKTNKKTRSPTFIMMFILSLKKGQYDNNNDRNDQNDNIWPPSPWLRNSVLFLGYLPYDKYHMSSLICAIEENNTGSGDEWNRWWWSGTDFQLQNK